MVYRREFGETREFRDRGFREPSEHVVPQDVQLRGWTTPRRGAHFRLMKLVRIGEYEWMVPELSFATQVDRLERTLPNLALQNLRPAPPTAPLAAIAIILALPSRSGCAL